MKASVKKIIPKRKAKNNFGETPEQRGVMITPERIVLYGLGVAAIVGTFWVAKKYIDSINEKVKNTDEGREKQDIVIKIDQSGATLPSVGGGASTNTGSSGTSTTPTTPTTPAVTEPEVVIPPITNDRYWGGVQNTERDNFPLLKGMGGLRVKALQQAYRILGWGINNATGYYGDVTDRITQQRLGKSSVSETDYVQILKQAKMQGLEGLDGFMYYKETKTPFFAGVFGLN